MSTPVKWSPEAVDFLRENTKGRKATEVTEMLNQTFGTSFTVKQVREAKKRYHLPSGVDTRFRKGHDSPNKGRRVTEAQYRLLSQTFFKKGHKAPNKLPIGTIVKNSEGYWQQKVGDSGVQRQDWVFCHRQIWESLHGPIPPGHVVTFLNGNKDDLDPGNLALVSREEHATLTRRNLRSEDPDITQNGVYIARLVSKINEKVRKITKNNEVMQKGEKENGD